jgi:hypothetical protein
MTSDFTDLKIAEKIKKEENSVMNNAGNKNDLKYD